MAREGWVGQGEARQGGTLPSSLGACKNTFRYCDARARPEAPSKLEAIGYIPLLGVLPHTHLACVWVEPVPAPDTGRRRGGTHAPPLHLDTPPFVPPHPCMSHTFIRKHAWG